MTMCECKCSLLFRNVDVVLSIVGEDTRFEPMLVVGVWFKIDKEITVRLGRSVYVRLYDMFRFSGIHLSREMSYLRFVPHVLKKNQILRV